jgi:hypothetical protein
LPRCAAEGDRAGEVGYRSLNEKLDWNCTGSA